MIELKNFSVAYGDNVVYDGLDFTFGQGVNALLGASGSGKTTLLRAVCGLIRHGGEVICEPASAVFQEPCLAPISALNNVRAVLRGKNSRIVAEEMLKRCRLDKVNERATRLSGGEQQRVALARAFAVDRPVLLLDEPFRSLDVGVRRKLYATLSELLALYPKTVLLVTHDVDEALLLADRVFLLEGRPAVPRQIAEVTEPRASRDEYSPEFISLKRSLQDVFTRE